MVQNRLENIVSLKGSHCSGKNPHPSSKLQLCHFSVSVTYVITRGQCHHRLQHREGGRCCLQKMKTSSPDPSRVCLCSNTKYNKFTSLPLLCEMEGGWLVGGAEERKGQGKKESESWKEMGAGIKAQLGRLLCNHKRYCLQILKQTSPTCVKACTRQHKLLPAPNAEKLWGWLTTFK